MMLEISDVKRELRSIQHLQVQDGKNKRDATTQEKMAYYQRLQGAIMDDFSKYADQRVRGILRVVTEFEAEYLSKLK